MNKCGLATELWKKKHEIVKSDVDDVVHAFHLEALDIIIAEKLAKDNKALFMLIVFLSASFRQGHLFISMSEAEIFPEPELILKLKEGMSCDFNQIKKMIKEAFLQIDVHSALVKDGTKLYFKNGWQQEQKVLFHYERLKKGISPRLSYTSPPENTLQPEQESAIQHALTSSLSCVFGGPGTGKTYTAGVFLKQFLKEYPKDELQQVRIALAGPTGKATANLEKSIQQALGREFDECKKYIEVKTLHALLGMRRFTSERAAPSFLPYQLFIVDETSMVDVGLMAEFLSRVPTGAKVLFLGDPNQLPPVEAGEVFSEFVKKEVNGGLKTCLRTDLQGILKLASFVNNGDEERVISLLLEGDSAVEFRSIESSTKGLIDAFAAEKERFSKKFHALLSLQASPHERLAQLGQFRLLSPRQDGPWGVATLNQHFYQSIEPIMISQNDYQLNLMNGEMGLLDKEAKCAFFAGKNQKEVRKVPAILLSRTERAYALSVHKSQGSEFDHVVLFLPPGSEVFGRRLLYTAITRARKKIEIWGSLETLKACIWR